MLSQRLRFPGIFDATPYLHAGYRCCAACAFGHLYTSFPNWQRGEARAKDNNLYGVMIPYGKYLVNYAKELPWLDSWTMITSWHLSRGTDILAPNIRNMRKGTGQSCHHQRKLLLLQIGSQLNTCKGLSNGSP